MSSAARGRGGSAGRGYQGSAARVFAACSRFASSLHEDVEMEWTINAYTITNNVTKVFAGSANFIVGGYFATHLLGVIGGGLRGAKVETGALLNKSYSGTPAPLTDTVAINNLTFPPKFSSTQLQWTGWRDSAGTPTHPFWEDTGSSMIFRGQYSIFHSDNLVYGATPPGSLVYGHWSFLTFNGANWVRAATLDWPIFYFDGLPAVNIGHPIGFDDINLRVEFQVEVTA